MTAPRERPKADPVRRETMVRVLIMALFGVLTLSVLIFMGVETPIEADNFTNSYSTSPGGHTALVELLKDSGRDVQRRAGVIELPEYNRRTGDALVLLEPGPRYVERYATEIEEAFEAARNRHGSVVISFPKRAYEVADPQPRGAEEIVLWERVHGEGRVEYVLEKTGFDRWLEIKRLDSGTIEWDADNDATRVDVDEPLQVFEARDGALPDSCDVLASTVDGEPVVLRYRIPGSDEGGVILISDPDVLTNRYIDRPGAGSFATRIFAQTTGGTLIFNEDIHGFSTDASVEYLALTPPGLWVTLSVLVLLGIFGWRQATVLRPRYAEPQDRRARKYAIEGLARMMERARDHGTAYRRLLWRARLVLGARGAEVHVGGQGTATGMRHRVDHADGADSEERFVQAARMVAKQARSGETKQHSGHKDQGQA